MDIYKKNIKALKKHHPDLAEMVEAIVVDEDRIKVLYAETGEPRLLYKKEDGEEIFIHSAEDPVKNANEAVNIVDGLGDEGVLIMFGFGLGYFAEEALKRFEKSHALIIYEAVPEVFKAALTIRDISALLESDRVDVILGEKQSSFDVIHKYYHLIYNGNYLVVKHHPSVKLSEGSYEDFFKIVTDEKKIALGQIVTGINRGKEFIDSDMENVPILIRKHGVKKLKDIFKGRPGIVVSAGPSLDKNVHLLKKAKGRAVIVAVDAAIATLLPCGILPDMVVAIEPSEKTLHMFNDNPVLKNVPLVALNVFQTNVFRFYPGPIFINQTTGYSPSTFFAGSIEDKGYIPVSGGSVAHFALSLIEYMGCKNIALTGQDLSFNKERFHSKGFADVLDMLDMDGSFNAKDIFGEDVLTRSDLFSYKLNFERKFSSFEGVAVNATEAGLPIDGTIPMRLIDFIEEYCADVSEIDIFSLLSGFMDDPVSYNLEDLIDGSTALMNSFKGTKQYASRILKYISKLEKHKEKDNRDSDEFHDLLAKTDALVEKFKKPNLNFLTGYSYDLEIYLRKFDIKEIDKIEDKWERLDSQLERGKKYYKEIVDTIALFNLKLDEMISELKRERKINAILIDNEVEQKKRLYKAGMLYRKAGIPAQAVRYLEPLIKEDALKSEFVRTELSKDKLYLYLAEEYINQFRFHEAKELLEKIVSRKSGEGKKQTKIMDKVEGLLKICAEKINLWEERKKSLRQVLKDAEENYGGHLASGYYYFRVKDYERAEKEYLKVIESHDAVSIAEAYYGLAHTYIAMDDSEKAVGFLEKAIEIDPSNPLFYRDLGFIAFQNNNVEAAELFLLKAIEISPENSECYKPLAELYMTIGQRDAAVALYEKALRRNPDNPVIQQELALFIKDTIREKEMEH